MISDPLRLPTNFDEQQLTADWLGSPDFPVVSVICHTYNHERYIAHAIEGFLAQRTSFPFEIIIHDDASTDGTVDIINQYANKFSQIIRPILQQVNQYSRAKWPPTFTVPAARGDWLAWCEGDDYWISPYKLQVQYDAMQSQVLCDLCFHKSLGIDARDGSHDIVGASNTASSIIDGSRIIRRDGVSIPTASIFARRDAALRFSRFMKENARGPVADLFLEFFSAERGGALYLDETLSVYRRFSKGSFSESYVKSTKKRIETVEGILHDYDLLRKSNEWSKKNLEDIDANIWNRVMRSAVSDKLPSEVKREVVWRYRGYLGALSYCAARLALRLPFSPMLVRWARARLWYLRARVDRWLGMDKEIEP